MNEIIQAKIKMRFQGTTLKIWNNPDRQKLLLILDQLRERIEAGENIETSIQNADETPVENTDSTAEETPAAE